MKVNHSDMKAVARGSWNDAQIRVLKRASALEHARARKEGSQKPFCNHSQEVGITRRLPEAVL